MKEKKQALQTILFVITFTVVLIYLVNHTGFIVSLFGKLIALLFPFLLGCGIAFVINIPMKGIEASLFKNKESKLYKFKRAISMVLAYLLVICVIVLVIFKVVPELSTTFATIGEKLPGVWEDAKAWVLKYTEKYPQITEEIMKIEINWDEVGSIFKSSGESIITTTVSIFSSIISAIVNIFIGLVFSIYILTQKEKLGRQTKMICYAVFKESTADEMMVFGKIANTTFAKFFTCQFREGVIFGSMIAIAMKICGMPYPLTIGILMAFTALIPIFGGFIGLFIGAFLILVDSPKYVLGFIILFFVVQFIENYVIYPRLVGEGIGLNAIWVLLAVLVGGELMGVVGMFVFIPLVSVIYAYTRSLIMRKLKNKNIDVDKKEVPEEVMPLMSTRRRLFQPKNKNVTPVDEGKKDVEDKTEAEADREDISKETKEAVKEKQEEKTAKKKK